MTEITLLLVAALGLVLAGVMAGISWRLHREERRRSTARVATLAADIVEPEISQRTAAVVGLRGEPRIQPVATRKFDAEGSERWPTRLPDSAPDLFRFEQRGPQSRLMPVLAVGIFAVAAALSLIVVTGRVGRRASAVPARSAAPAPSLSVARSPGGGAPLELLALKGALEGDLMTVRGVVRNPSGGQRFERLTAVVVFFSRDGELLGTGRTPLQPAVFSPGLESAFIVTTAHARDVSRYRVRFHSDDRVVAHIDRRSAGSTVSPK